MIRFITLLTFLLVSSPAQTQTDTEILYPITGTTKIYVRMTKTLENFQLIPITSREKYLESMDYLVTVMRDENLEIIEGISLHEFLSVFADSDTAVTYLFLSPATTEFVLEQPYFKNRSIWFDLKVDSGDDQYVSLWMFKRPADSEFRIRLHKDDLDLEYGMYTLMSGRVDEEPHNRVYRDLRILAFGEIFVEPFLQLTQTTKDTIEVTDFKSYSDSIRVRLGTYFGIQYEYTGEDTTTEKEFTFRLTHPEFLEGPKKGETQVITTRVCKADEIDYFIWGFAEDYEIVSGKWTIQVADGGTTVYSKDFFISN